MKYAVVIEKTDNGYSAYLPDLPGCITAGDSLQETEDLIQEAVSYHLEMLRENGEPISKPQASTVFVEA
ncbi:MAG: type II toxin-antitoxin system HicB family antitoxin [Chloroflexi bacterium]|nr:type II toxin-antitoxin system HicB family antitoxin [Chloroflexota bacterium]